MSPMSLLSSLSALTIEPFVEFGFMRRALVATLALGLAAGPLGSILVLRRMSLMGDALSHAVLPGVALGFLLGGLSLPFMSLGGVISGLIVALGAGLVTRFTRSAEDASFASFYLIALAIGVVLVSLKGSNVDLLRLLFGSILGIDHSALIVIASLVSLALVVLAVIWRPLDSRLFRHPVSCRDGGAGRTVARNLSRAAGPGAGRELPNPGNLNGGGADDAARNRRRDSGRSRWGVIVPLSSLIAMAAGVLGLILSFATALPAGPAIILVAGLFYLGSLLLGPLRSHPPSPPAASSF